MREPFIRVLPDTLINLIAAGEIIERPASVVKELVENSLDAEARSIVMELVVGGKQRIAVVDDGIGMSSDDARLSIQRHATSKIRDKNDLMEIHTLGFRGEALPSIASVSRFSLFTRQQDNPVGTEIRVEGGSVRYVRDAGTPTGTRIIVDDLFYSVPARRKFLKSDKTEYLNAYDVVVRHALARPDVGFRLIADGREVINTPSTTLKGRAGDVLGGRIARSMGEVEREEEGIRVTGIVGRPEETRSTQSAIHLFVNDRPVRDYGIASAVIRAYAGLIFGGRFPVAVIFIQLPLGDVDVNIHPTKREVKFRDPRTVGGVVYRAVEEAVRALTRVTIPLTPEPSYRAVPGGNPPHEWRVREQSELFHVHRTTASNDGLTQSHHKDEAVLSIGWERGTGLDTEVPDDDRPSTAHARQGARSPSQAAGTYIVLPDDDGIVIIDQHAAHERVIYERIKAGLDRNNIPMQRLLFPIKLDLEGPDRELVVSHIDKINAIGLEVSDFGGKTVLVSAVPSIVKDADVTELVLGIIEELREGTGGSSVEDTVDRMIKAVACHGSIRAGTPLTPVEMEGLIAELERTPFAAHCPHGRPTMIRIGADEIAHRFKRT